MEERRNYEKRNLVKREKNGKEIGFKKRDQKVQVSLWLKLNKIIFQFVNESLSLEFLNKPLNYLSSYV